MRGPGLAALLAALVPVACASSGGPSEDTKEIAVNVLTLQTGTMSELKNRRGQGPFTIYEVSPAVMLDVLERAMRRAGPEKAPPYVGISVSANYREVSAKEYGAPGKGYSDPFRSAVIAIVHPIRDEPERCRVEIHTIQRGPFHQGRVPWARELPGWIDDALLDRTRLRPIP